LTEDPKEDGEELKLPKGLDWNIHRIAASEHYSSSLIEIQTQWTLADIARAHQTLNAFRDAEVRERIKRRKRDSS